MDWIFGVEFRRFLPELQIQWPDYSALHETPVSGGISIHTTTTLRFLLGQHDSV
jgi:hypothetical protein